jgi:hypothetical protein
VVPEYQLSEVMRLLPPEQQREVLNFARSLASKAPEKQPLRSIRGLWRDLNITITSEDIDEARREMWGNFPREDI